MLHHNLNSIAASIIQNFIFLFISPWTISKPKSCLAFMRALLPANSIWWTRGVSVHHGS